MKKFFAIILSILIFVFSIINIQAVTKSTYKTYGENSFFSDGENSFIVSTDGSNAIINQIGNGHCTIRCAKEIKRCQYANNEFHFFYENSEKKLCVAKYNLKRKKITDISLDINTKLDYVTASVDKNGYYYATDKINRTKLYCFNTKGLFLKSYNIEHTIFQADSINGNYIAIRTSGGIYYIHSGEVTYLSGKFFKDKIKMINNTCFISDGNIFSLTNNLEEVFSHKNNKVAVIDQGFVFCSTDTVYFCPYKNSKETKEYTINGEISNIYGYNDTIFVVTENNVYTIRYKELSNIRTASKGDVPMESVGYTSDGYGIRSDVYTFVDDYIFDVMPSTSVTRFKDNLSYNGYELNLYDGEYYVPRGNVYTGLTASFTGNGTVNKTLIVKGDITCDGSVNTNDVKLMMEYLLDITTLSGNRKLAGDVIKDNKLNNKDLVAIAQLRN